MKFLLDKRSKPTNLGIVDLVLNFPKFIVLCFDRFIPNMLDDRYDAWLSVSMSTINERVVGGLWVCLCLCMCEFGGLRACGVGILKTSVSFNYYDLF